MHRNAANPRPVRRAHCRAYIRSAVFAALAAGASSARADVPGFATGMLTCSAPAGHSLVIGSVYTVDCVFAPAAGASERYVGEMRRAGIDIGFSNGAHMAWAVFAYAGSTPGSLSGSYVGASAGVAPGLGAGANVLVGGGERSISLQPVSVEFKTGLNLTVGVASLTLRRP